MLRYEQFKDLIITEIEKQIEPDKLYVGQTYKNNTKLDAISIFKGNDIPSPALYINEMYERYTANTFELEDIIKAAAQILHQETPASIKIESVDEFLEYKNDLFYTLINKDSNIEYLNGIPHRDVPGTDLSIIYRKLVDRDELGMSSAVINYESMKKMGMTENDLYNLSIKDTPRLFPARFFNVMDVVIESFIDMGASEEDIELMKEMAMKDSIIFAISNDIGVNGAAAMLYKDELANAASRLGDDLYVIPSSIHEVLVIPKGDFKVSDITALIQETNMSEVRVQERLSNNLYEFNAKTKELKQVSDISNRTLSMPVESITREKGRTR